MKKELFGALLTLSPFGNKGEAQEAKARDKVLPETEYAKEKPAANALAKDKKTANPWHLTLESNISILNKPGEAISGGENILKSADSFEMISKTEQEMALMAPKIFDICVAKNTLYKEISKVAENNGLKNETQLWENYKAGKISAAEAAQQLRFAKLPFPFDPKIILLDRNLTSLTEKSGETISDETSLMLSNYFSKAEIFEELKNSQNNFNKGLVLMDETLGSLKNEKLSISGLTEEIKNNSKDLPYEAKLGALSFFNQALYKNYNNESDRTNSVTDLDKMVANAALYLRGDMGKPAELGVCRDYAALVSELAQKGLGLNASVITAPRHDLVQIKNEKGITLIDQSLITSSVDGHSILTKDDVDAALIKNYQEPTISDLTIEAGGDKVLYENRHNNFAGLMNKLTNRDNLSLRAPEFLAGSDKLDLFPRLSEAGVSRGILEKGNIGVEAYWLRNNNEYKDFLESMKGLNIAGYVPAEFSLNKLKFKNIFFANVGFYHSVLNLAAEKGGQTKTLDMNMSLENYFRCSINTSLTAGLIAKLADFNLELSRSGEKISKTKSFEYHGSLSPFISFEVPGGVNKGEDGREKTSRTYLCSGLEVTDYLALPDLKKLSTIPWFQAGFEYNKKEIDLGLKLRGEFQPASSRFDFDSFLKKGSNQLELRTYLELYNQKFQELTPYQNVAGIEAGIRHDLKNGQNLFLMLSAKSEGGNVKQILLNLGFKF